MNIKIPLWAALVAGFPLVASGFTLDAVGYQGSELALNPPSIFLPGYGEVVFDSGSEDPIGVNPAYQNVSDPAGTIPVFHPSQAVRIQHVDSNALEESIDFEMRTDPISARLATVDDGVHLNAAGIHLSALETESIPEAASAVLGLLGMMILIFLRSR